MLRRNFVTSSKDWRATPALPRVGLLLMMWLWQRCPAPQLCGSFATSAKSLRTHPSALLKAPGFTALRVMDLASACTPTTKTMAMLVLPSTCAVERTMQSWSGQLWTARPFSQCWTRTPTSWKGCPRAEASPQAKTMLTQVSSVCLEKCWQWQPRNLSKRTECRTQSCETLAIFPSLGHFPVYILPVCASEFLTVEDCTTWKVTHMRLMLLWATSGISELDSKYRFFPRAGISHSTCGLSAVIGDLSPQVDGMPAGCSILSLNNNLS